MRNDSSAGQRAQNPQAIATAAQTRKEKKKACGQKRHLREEPPTLRPALPSVHTPLQVGQPRHPAQVCHTPHSSASAQQKRRRSSASSWTSAVPPVAPQRKYKTFSQSKHLGKSLFFRPFRRSGRSGTTILLRASVPPNTAVFNDGRRHNCDFPTKYFNRPSTFPLAGSPSAPRSVPAKSGHQGGGVHDVLARAVLALAFLATRVVVTRRRRGGGGGGGGGGRGGMGHGHGGRRQRRSRRRSCARGTRVSMQQGSGRAERERYSPAFGLQWLQKKWSGTATGDTL